MGTELLRRGYYGPSWRANLDTPALVRTIHDEYRSAGACVLLANTFLAAEASPEALHAGLRLAREAAAGAWVVASIGPSRSHEPLVAAARALADADAILLETWSDRAVFDLIRALHPAPPLLVSFSFRRTANAAAPVAFDGSTPSELATQAASAGVAALGVNCGRDQSPEDCAAVLREYRNVTDLPLFARPNAGSPVAIDGGWQYPLAADDWARRTAKLDATMLGGCCGTTPDHIARLANHLQRPVY